MRVTLALSVALFGSFAFVGCASAPPPAAQEHVDPQPPPKDDGNASKFGVGGTEHAAALEELKIGPFGGHVDKQRSLRILLPDPTHWTRVRFWGVESLVGFRYGKEHHAIVGGFITHVPDNKVQGACGKSFEQYAKPYVDSFDVEITHETPSAFIWQKEFIDVDVLHAKVATVFAKDEYTAAFASYPAWDNACLTVGIAVPYRGEQDRAIVVRDRFVKDVLPRLVVTRPDEPKERY